MVIANRYKTTSISIEFRFRQFTFPGVQRFLDSGVSSLISVDDYILFQNCDINILKMKIHYTLDQLIVLEAIVRTGSFAAAAKELYRVPSAISYSIACLEEALDIVLFDRSKRKAQLTQAGRRIHQEALEFLGSGKTLQHLAQSFKDGWEPELQIIVDGILPLKTITTALRPFSKLDIPTRVRLDIEYQEGVPDRFFADQADLMIILNFTDESNVLESFPLPPVDLVLVASSEHMLSSLEEVTKEDLTAHMDLVVRDSSPSYAHKPKKSSFMNSKNLLFLSDFHSKRLLLLEGIGYGWMPRYLIANDLLHNRLQILNKDLNSWTYSPTLVKRRTQELGKAGQLFMDTLLNHQNI